MTKTKVESREESRKGAIVFGMTMQERLPVVPKVVVEWVKDRVAKYPVDFKIDVSSTDPRKIAEQFERVFYFHRGRKYGVNVLAFPYLDETWYVKIIGGIDKSSNIVGGGVDVVAGLPGEIRDEISGLAEIDAAELQDIDEKSIGLIRREPLVSIKEIEHEIVESDFQWTSELTLSGEELSDLLENPVTKAEAMEAIYAKDWAKLGKLAGKKIH